MVANQEYTNEKFTSTDITQIGNRLTEDRFLILKAIHDTPEIRHKALSEKLNKSPNNLSNMIKKINNMDFELIRTTKIGTEKYYSLSPIATQCVEQRLSTVEQPTKNSRAFHFQSTDTILKKASAALKSFMESYGQDWFSTSSDLIGQRDANVKTDIQEAYNILLDTLCDCRKQDYNTLQQFLQQMEDEQPQNKQLIDQIRNYLDKKFIYYDYFKPLLELNKTDIIKSFKIIDNLFSELHPLVFSLSQDEESQDKGTSKPLLPAEKHNNLLLGVVKLSAEFINKRYSKSEAVSKWEADYLLSEECAFYIAEKCSLLMLVHKFHN